jgi:hypothetical protein
MDQIIRRLIDNSKASQWACIEIHNKPLFPFRYETCSILNINSWELILKAFILKHFPKIKVIYDDGTTKPFDECLSFVASELGKDFTVARENLNKLYEYRCNSIHFFQEDVNILLYGLLSKNLLIYRDFLSNHFDIDITGESNMILLPVGFRKPTSPIDFLSDESSIKKSSTAVQSFVKSIIKSSQLLEAEDVEDSILFSFKMALLNESRIKNADVIAAITKDKSKAAVNIENVLGKIILTDDDKADGVKEVKIDEETLFKDFYTYTYDSVAKKCKQMFSDFKQNSDFNKQLKKVKGKAQFHKTRYLNLNNPKGGSKDYYTSQVFEEFSKYYTKKEE